MSTVVSKPGRSVTPPALTRMFRLWGSSLGQKVVMAITGVVLSGFVLGHMAGNLQVFQGPEAINAYSKLLHREPALLWGARVVLLRTGLVLSRHGGLMGKLRPLFSFMLGGRLGNGRQYMPWIHRDDLVGIYLAALDNNQFAGPINASAPEPVTNKQFAKALGRAINRPAVAPVPGFTIKLMYGEMAQIVLGGVRMVPGRAEALGYTFEHTDLDEALRDTLE